ncbi:MAG: hypothetical protein R6U29_06960 [Desulfosudaceae bacterium]
MPIIKLTNYLLGTETGLLPVFNLAARENEFWIVESERPEKTNLFFRALATLVTPLRGEYRFLDRRLDFSDYDHLLECKKKIGFISPDIALTSNRTIRENLLLTHYYETNTLALPLTSQMEKMSLQLGIIDQLDQRVTEISQWDLRSGLIIRELNKPYELLLIDRPESLVPPDKQPVLIHLLQNQEESGKAIICHSRDKKYIDNFSPTGKIKISQDEITITPPHSEGR